MCEDSTEPVSTVTSVWLVLWIVSSCIIIILYGFNLYQEGPLQGYGAFPFPHLAEGLGSQAIALTCFFQGSWVSNSGLCQGVCTYTPPTQCLLVTH